MQLPVSATGAKLVAVPGCICTDGYRLWSLMWDGTEGALLNAFDSFIENHKIACEEMPSHDDADDCDNDMNGTKLINIIIELSLEKKSLPDENTNGILSSSFIR